MKTLATITICAMLCASMAEPVQAGNVKRIDDLLKRGSTYMAENRAQRRALNILRINLLSRRPLYYNSRVTRSWRSRTVSNDTDAPFMKCTNTGKKVTCK